MNTKIKVIIQNDYNSTLTYELRNENIENLLSELDLYCEISNNNFINIVEQLQQNTTHKDDYKDFIVINAAGYSQSEWQEYKLYYNEKDTDKKILDYLVSELEKSFTHQNDYIAKIYKEIKLGDEIYTSDIIDCYSIAINDIEFPDEKDIIKRFDDYYCIEYDTIEINID